MSSPTSIQKITYLSTNNINNLYKPLIFTGLFLFLFYTLLSNRDHLDLSPQYLAKLRQTLYTNHQPKDTNDPTNISHIVIGIASSIKSWKSRKSYIESWWQPNVTKGYVFLDGEPTYYRPWPSSSPPYRIYENTDIYKPYDRHPMKSAIRMVRVIVEIFREAHNDQGIRWFVMADDDTIFFLDNLMEMLQKYDHKKYYYIGENSECVLSNFANSFEMAFGGAGYAISYPLAEVLVKNMDVCIKRYPYVYGSDHLMQSCIADLGVSLTHEKGFHQIDLHRDLSGYLSSHPQTPILSLHHLDTVDPIFPNMSRSEALNHLMKAATEDQPRLLQQTICYDNTKNLSFSVAWGYTAQIYEKIIPPSVLKKPLETFSAWSFRAPKQPFMFNTRWLSKNPCDMPHVFFFQSVERITENNEIITNYTRRTTRNMLHCSSSSSSNGNFSSSLTDDIATIIVVSPATKYSAQIMRVHGFKDNFYIFVEGRDMIDPII
ncbi:uncharacterized protein LOC104900444 [Beta vulgaris subsp. vulgaris]|uniref:uncharacterized protein LOC104900444 n=1 Tax=Beta vulgaris subsp. vulgaris TaxID=3555 RepID=UPI0020369F9B|nr:uncharacterized protein LOC104900444 [Beta vulgaris subsp. vulgaris]